MRADTLLFAALGLAHCGQAIFFGSPGNCACLNWKETYDSHKVTCGDALEQFTYSRKAGVHSVNFHFCEGASAYNQQNGTYCTKVAQGSTLPVAPKDFTEGAWCYVSSSCSDLNGGAPVNDAVSWKSCRPDQDAFLADLNPADLISYANRNKQDIGLLVQMSYPVLREVTAAQAREVFLPELPQRLRPEQRKMVEDVIASNRPTIFCDTHVPEGNPDACGAGEVYVVVGKDIWRMDTMQCRTGDKGCTPYAS